MNMSETMNRSNHTVAYHMRVSLSLPSKLEKTVIMDAAMHRSPRLSSVYNFHVCVELYVCCRNPITFQRTPAVALPGVNHNP